MLVLNVIFLVLGAITFFYHDGPEWLIALRFSAVMLVFFTMAGYIYDFPRLYLYGALCALAIPLGEWLWRQGLVSHHGFPVVFGSISGIIFLLGLYRFISTMRLEAPQFEEHSIEGGI